MNILSDDYLALVNELEQYYAKHARLRLSDQLLKVQEEVGEVAAAYIGLYGLNPRKGETHEIVDVAMELADVVMAALVGIAMCGFELNECLSEQAAKTRERLDEYTKKVADGTTVA
jgi:NTP pyrophosphatase (non-canonical NTP hydrolase)